MEYVEPGVPPPGEDWSSLIPDEQWTVYGKVIDALEERGLRFALGGAFARAAYTGLWRNAKDLDLYILPDERDAFVEVLESCGLKDYHDELPYDRSWIYRSHDGETILDLIWTFPNHVGKVDERWLTAGPSATVRGKTLQIIPPEELIWAKLYVLQRERCDWPDILNIVYMTGLTLDWHHLLGRVGEDKLLLGGIMGAFRWMCPGRAAKLPGWIWTQLSMEHDASHRPEFDERRVDLLESRPWFCGKVVPASDQG